MTDAPSPDEEWNQWPGADNVDYGDASAPARTHDFDPMTIIGQRPPSQPPLVDVDALGLVPGAQSAPNSTTSTAGGSGDPDTRQLANFLDAPKFDSIVRPIREFIGGLTGDVVTPLGGMGDVKRLDPEPPALTDFAFDGRLRDLMASLLNLRLKADTLAPSMVGKDLNDQLSRLRRHLDLLEELLDESVAAGSLSRDLEDGIVTGLNAGGLNLDLMYLDANARLGRVALYVRSHVNAGLAWTWSVMDGIASDPTWPSRAREEVAVAELSAAEHREEAASWLKTSGVVTSAVRAAQIVDFVRSFPQLFASGQTALQGLVRWLAGNGGGGGGPGVALATVGNQLVIRSGSAMKILEWEEIEGLRAIGALSFKTVSLYGSLQGPPVGQSPSMASVMPMAKSGAIGPKGSMGSGRQIGLSRYGGPGGGHHVGPQSAFRGDPRYNPKEALVISVEEMERMGVTHSNINRAQNVLYGDFLKSGKQLTWSRMAEIETRVLTEQGVSRPVALKAVNRAINHLKSSGVRIRRRPFESLLK